MAGRKKDDIVFSETIVQKPMEEVMHDSMMPYSEYVILERALPRVEDGLKPVQRRILYTMHELGITPDKPHKKCARIVGDCLGKYHPHGDTSVYDALARMAQPFVMRGMLVDGHGNFGSIDGDSPAAMRYTEARMTNLALELLRDIDKDTVGFHLNFDDTQREPDMLPGRFPNLLVNGASGIAVGVATNIPPHNLGEAISAVIAQIENPEITLPELMEHMPAPDFPTGGVLMLDEEMENAYRTGRGKLTVRAKTHIEKGMSGRSLIVITEVPYQVNKAAMLEKILRLSEEKKALLGGIYDIRDESDRTGMRAVVELKRDVDAEKVLAALYKYSDLQTTFGVNMVAIAEGKPMQMGLKTVIGHYIRHQRDVVTRRTRYELNQLKARAHVLEGLIIAVDNLDEVIRLIRMSKTPKEARERLIERFTLTEVQAQAILDMRLQRLTNLEIVSLREEFAQILKRIDALEQILKSEKKLLKVIITELQKTKEQYADPRRTQIEKKRADEPQVEIPKIEAEEAVVILTDTGFLKRMAPRAYERAIQQQEESEAVRHIFNTMTDQRLLFFTDAGFCYPVSVSQVPECRLKDRGLPLNGLLMGLEANENLVELYCVKQEDYAGDLLFITARGQVKRTAFSEYAVRKPRFASINLKKGDRLVAMKRAVAEELMLLISRGGMAIHFDPTEVPSTGRTTGGVRGMSVGVTDEVRFAITDQLEGELLLISDRGYMKRCLMVDFDPQARGGKGLKCFTFLKSGANGEAVAGAMLVLDPVNVTVRQKNGTATKVFSDNVKIDRRDGKGLPFVVAVMDDVVTDMRVE